MTTIDVDLPTEDEGDTERSAHGLRFLLRETDEPRSERQPPSPSTALSPQETHVVLARLGDPEAPHEEAPAFAFPTESLPPPASAKTVMVEGRTDATSVVSPDVASETLELLRRAPEGEVDLAPRLGLTFSSPMVPVATSTDLAALDVLADLTPQPPGAWRWLDTRTLVFEPEGRFPMATRYEVRVEAGTRSVGGEPLAQTVAWTFATPAPRLLHSHPNRGPQGLEPVIFAAFDQRIDAEAVLTHTRVRCKRRHIAVRLATSGEVDADATVRDLARAAEPDTWIAFRPVEPLPEEAPITVSFDAGTPSAEGPRATDAAQEFTFRTRGPLKILGHRSGWRRKCHFHDSWHLRLSNPLDAVAFDESLVRVEPELPGQRVEITDDHITIDGHRRARTTYRVTLGAALRDVWGPDARARRDALVSRPRGGADALRRSRSVPRPRSVQPAVLSRRELRLQRAARTTLRGRTAGLAAVHPIRRSLARREEASRSTRSIGARHHCAHRGR